MRLTRLETIVTESLRQADEFDGVPTDCILNLVDNTGINTKILRGVLTSLVNKGLVQLGEFPNGMIAYHYRGE